MDEHGEFYPAAFFVEVLSRLDQQWARGFEGAEPVEAPRPGYLIRRRSDGWVLPGAFSREEVREDPRRINNM